MKTFFCKYKNPYNPEPEDNNGCTYIVECQSIDIAINLFLKKINNPSLKKERFEFSYDKKFADSVNFSCYYCTIQEVENIEPNKVLSLEENEVGNNTTIQYYDYRESTFMKQCEILNNSDEFKDFCFKNNIRPTLDSVVIFLEKHGIFAQSSLQNNNNYHIDFILEESGVLKGSAEKVYKFHESYEFEKSDDEGW